jgi:RNA polymerase sigma-70 factor, ECF subfamily
METMTLSHTDYASFADAELLRLIASGKSEALEALYDRYVRACYGKALGVVVDPYVAEEVVQDVFLKLWAAPSSYVPERGKFPVWLLTLAHNRAIDRLRHDKHVMTGNSLPFDAFDPEETGDISPAEMLSDGANTPYEEAWRQEQSRTVRKALSLLSASQREAISLAYLGGLTQWEIAQRLGVPLGTIKTRIRGGLQHLRRLLDGQSLMEDAA